ncbi:MAG: hypothetical protein QNJ53_30745 [Pleurocapsa sp. MO_192.B19]|nr:hypothetical protein [Pleurocapsa sp. MO_192.B19]
MEHFRPLAKVKPKAFVEKGLDGRGCFDFPDVGDVERITKTDWRCRILGCFDFPDVGDVERFLERLCWFRDRGCFDSPDVLIRG